MKESSYHYIHTALMLGRGPVFLHHGKYHSLPLLGAPSTLHKLLIAYGTMSHKYTSALHMLPIAYGNVSHKAAANKI